jgi:UDP-glucose 4-epimerase
LIKHNEAQPRVPGRVVLLGASGFIGQDLLRYLRDAGVENLALSSTDVDLTRPEAVEKLKAIVREGDSLVIVSAITPDKGKDVGTLMRNLSMGEHVSAFLEEALLAQVIYISSDAVYADDANPVRENSCCDPSSFHGLMHLVRERMFASALQKTGTPYMILRPCAVYGAGDTHNSYGPNRFLRAAIKEYKISLFGQGEEKRDHVSVKDVSSLAGLCLLHRSQGILNVATGESVSFFDVAEMVTDISGERVRVEGSERANPVTHRHFDIAAVYKAFPDFEFTPLRSGLSEMLKETRALGA